MFLVELLHVDAAVERAAQQTVNVPMYLLLIGVKKGGGDAGGGGGQMQHGLSTASKQAT